MLCKILKFKLKAANEQTFSFVAHSSNELGGNDKFIPSLSLAENRLSKHTAQDRVKKI